MAGWDDSSARELLYQLRYIDHVMLRLLLPGPEALYWVHVRSAFDLAMNLPLYYYFQGLQSVSAEWCGLHSRYVYETDANYD